MKPLVAAYGKDSMHGENIPDIVIIGAGPSGLVLALALAHYETNVRWVLIARAE
jgi:cation diffusion facilitator CzcD-associated flavoprotein CzcO